MANFPFIEDPLWFDESPDSKQAMIDVAFEDQIASDPLWANESPDSQQAIKDSFNQDAYDAEYRSPVNPNNIQAQENQLKGEQGFFGNAYNKIKGSIDRNLSQMSEIGDVATGEFDPNAASNFAQQMATAQGKFIPEAEQQTLEDVSNVKARWDANPEGMFETTKAILGSAYDVGKSVAGNLEGAAYVTLDSIDSLINYAVGAYAGGKAATPIALVLGSAGPQAAVPFDEAAIIGIGSAIGAFTAQLPAEAVGYFKQKLSEELQARELLPTAYNIEKLLADNGFTAPAVKAAKIKAATTSFVDTLTGGVAGRIGTAPIRAARREAVKRLGKGASTQAIDNAAHLILKKGTSPGSKLRSKIQSYTTEVLSEPISEGAGTLAAGDGLDPEGLALETIGGIGSGPMSTAVSTGAFGTKLAKDTVVKTPAIVKEVLTPKSAELKKAKVVNKAPTTHKFQQKVDEAVETGDINQFTNPESNEYSPLHAISALRSMNQKEGTSDSDQEQNIDKAFEVYTDYQTTGEELQSRINALSERPKGELSKEEQRELNDVTRLQKEYQNTFSKMDRVLQAMRNQNEPTDIGEVDLTESIESGNDEQIKSDIVRSFGSSSYKNSTTKVAEAAKTLRKRSGLSAEIKTFLDNIIGLGKTKTEYDQVASKAPTSSKGVMDVRKDLFKGSHGFKGIDNYITNISNYMASGNKLAAAKQLAGLKNIAGKQRTKATTVRKALEAGDPNQKAWFAPIVESEADNLEQAVKLAEQMIGTEVITQKAQKKSSEGPVTTKKKKASKSTSKEEKPSKEVKTPKTKEQSVEKEKVETKSETKEKTPEKESFQESKSDIITVEVTQWKDGVKAESKTVPVEQAVENIDKEIALYEEIRKCVKS